MEVDDPRKSLAHLAVLDFKESKVLPFELIAISYFCVGA
jgi:hypothetical protein